MTCEDTDRSWHGATVMPCGKKFYLSGSFTRESHENWIRTHVETGDVVQMIICDLANDKLHGSVYIRDIDRHHNKAEYGIFIGEADARGRGAGTAAAKLMLRYCFEENSCRVYLRAVLFCQLRKNSCTEIKIAGLPENGQAIRSGEADEKRQSLLGTASKNSCRGLSVGRCGRSAAMKANRGPVRRSSGWQQ